MRRGAHARCNKSRDIMLECLLMRELGIIAGLIISQPKLWSGLALFVMNAHTRATPIIVNFSDRNDE